MLVKKGYCSHCGWLCCGPCASLNGRGLCMTYHSRPHGCRIYPMNPAMLELGCTYWFEDERYPGVPITHDNWNNEHFFPIAVSSEWLKECIESVTFDD